MRRKVAALRLPRGGAVRAELVHEGDVAQEWGLQPIRTCTSIYSVAVRQIIPLAME